MLGPNLGSGPGSGAGLMGRLRVVAAVSTENQEAGGQGHLQGLH